MIIRIITLVIVVLVSIIVGPVQAATQNEIQKLIASDGGIVDEFGDAVAVDGNTAVIGARLDDDGGFDSGSAYVFTRSSGVWTEEQKLTASDAAANDFFGMRVAVDGDTIVIGAEADDDDGASSGSAYVFVRNAGVWTEQQKLTASDAAEGDWFGSSVAVDGDTAIIGAERADDNGTNSGSAYVFTRNAGVWTEQQKLTASNGFDFDDFGNAVAMDGDTAVIGARWGDNGGVFSDVGAAYVFTRNSGVWSEQQKLIASDGAFEDQFGVWVGLDGDTAIIGAQWDDDSGSRSGSAYVFTRDAGVWTEQQKLTASDGAADDEFGASVAVSGNVAVIGAKEDDDNGSSSGSAYLFARSAGVWTEQPKLIASDAAAFDEFGHGVAIDEETVLVGAARDDDNNPASGSVYVFAIESVSDILLDLEALPDVADSAAVDAAVLVANATVPSIDVYVRDGSTGRRISQMSVLDSRWRAIDLAVMSDGGANALIGVLAQKNNGAINVAVHRADDGTFMRQIAYFNQNWVPSALAYVVDAAGPGVSAFAVLAKNSLDDRVSVQLRRISDGSLINTLLVFRDIWDEIDLGSIDDISGNSRPEVMVVGQSDLGRIVTVIMDAMSGQVINRISYFGAASTPKAITSIASIGGSAAPELPLLAVKGNGRNTVQVRDASTDAVVSSVFFFNTFWRSMDIGGLGDVNGNSAADMVVFARHKTKGTIQGDVRDAATNALIRSVKFLGPLWTPQAFAVFSDITGNGIQELGVVAENDNGDIKLQLKDALTGLIVKTINIP